MTENPDNLFLVALEPQELLRLQTTGGDYHNGCECRTCAGLRAKLNRAVPFEKAVEAAATEYRRYPYRSSTDAIFAMRAALHAATSPPEEEAQRHG